MNKITFKNGTIYPESIVVHEDTTYFLVRLPGGEKQLVVRGDTAVFQGTPSADGLIAPLTPANAAALRQRLPWLNPAPLGAQTSYGFGDRIGLATPGHVAALRATGAVGRIAPIFAQQSVRENTRIGRNPQLVMDAATWGLLQT
ncbi:MAG: hypothetical protein KBE23_23885, partial [Chloroflexi bacterium]|nr:hypothetical protein [Chloroflexota bacterium]